MGTTDIGMIRTDTGLFLDKGNEVFNVKHLDFGGGAKGDGVTDDTLAIQSALDTAGAGSVVYFPVGTYKITSALTVTTAGLTIMGAGVKSILEQATSNTSALSVSASDVTVRNIKLVGPQFAASQTDERAITASGASSSSYISGLRVENCELTTWGRFGVFMEFVEDFFITNTHIEDIYYGAVFGQSVRRGIISNNRIENIPASGSVESYGIALLRQDITSLSTHPRSSDVVVDGNVIKSIKGKAALEARGGERIVFSSNTILECVWGINVGPSKNTSAADTYAPIDCVVTGNVIDSNQYSEHIQGMQLAGARSGSTLTAAATGCTVTNNVFRECGGENSGASGADTDRAIYVDSTESCKVAGNIFVQPSRNGVYLDQHNNGFAVNDNTFVDAWTTSGSAYANGVLVSGNGNNKGIISNNTFEQDPNATFKASPGRRMYIGIYVTGDSTDAVSIGTNRFDVTGSDIYDPNDKTSGPPAVSGGTITGTTITASTAFVPDASDGATLGTAALEFSDLYLADAGVIYFGDDQDVSLTHVHDTGLLLNGTRQLQFYDASQRIAASSATVMTIAATDEIDLQATAIDINGTVDMSSTLTVAGAVQIDAALTVGVDDTGYDVKFFGATASAYMLWDQSADDLILAGAAGLDVDGVTNLDVVDIDGAVDMASTLQVDGAITGSSTIQGTTITATTALVGTTLTVNKGSNTSVIELGGSPGANWEGDILFNTSNSATNWRLASNRVTAGAFTITPSTAGGGSTYTTPRVTVTDGAMKLAGSDTMRLEFLNAAGTLRSFLTLNSTSLEIDTDSALIFSPNNAERARIDDSGRMGIGTASPHDYYTTNLVIAKTSSGGRAGMSIVNANDGTGRIDFADGTSGAAMYRGTISYAHNSTAADGYMRFVAGGSEALRLGSNYVLMSNLPTSDPGVSGSVWNDSGTLKIS